ncbi:hypothetical protein [Streptomyces sp. NP-1717]|uniref:hypothetical protein n=1 Tax=Streptomyces sp. NP-1717 TaxID=2704470 RepID=UPI001F5DA0B5|nr:hypothetical protein [Streptomyces sp. NP-1717]MCI3225644.1 hypothetical protein [Streptomyces sp. NP-1717]
MRLAEHTVVSAAYALADRELTRALVPRVREETVALLGSETAVVPPHLLDEVIGSRDPELLGALLSSARHRGVVFDRLAALGDPALARALYGGQEWDRTPAQRAAVWEGAVATAGDPGWRSEDGLPAKLLSSRRRELLEPALLAPFPELVAHARSVLDGKAGSGRGAGSGPRMTPPSTTPLKDRRSWERHPQSTKELIGDFRDRDFRGTTELPGAPGTPGALDWDVLVKEHRAEPFLPSALVTLWSHPDCPEELALAAFEARWNSTLPEGAVHWSMVASPAFGRLENHALSKLLGRGLLAGAFPAERVLGETGPARNILCALPHDHAEARTALAAQVARLGSDFAPWRAVYSLLPRFSGTVTELVDAALAEEGKHRGKPWPKPVGPEFPSRGGSIGRAAWLHLYDAADHDTQCALVAHLDLRAIQHLLLWHRPSPELRAHIVRSRGASVLAGIASSWQTPPEVIEELIPYNESEINAALFLNTDLTPAQRRHVLSGRRWRDGESVDTPDADRIPLTKTLVQGLEESARRPWLLACADSGDPVPCRILLGSPRVKIHTPALELRMLVRLWERHGPDEVRALLDETHFPGRNPQPRHPLSPPTLEAGRAAVDAEAEPEGLALLRAAYEAAAGPAGRADFLSEKGAGVEKDDLAKAVELFDEEVGPGPLPWDELVAAHGAKPLHDRVLVRLAGLDGCPAALAEESAGAALRLSHPHYRPRRGVRPPTGPDMLKKLPLRLDNGGCRWLEKAHALGQVTLDEVVRTGFPAQATIAFLSRALAPGDSPGTEEVRSARRAVAALATEHLSDDPEGWALALRLAPDFEGTLPDLLLASGAVVS